MIQPSAYTTAFTYKNELYLARACIMLHSTAKYFN